MMKLNKDHLLLCDIQGKVFENSVTYQTCSSAVFIRRFMLSDVCKRMDHVSFLNEATSLSQIYQELDEQYGISSYGKEKYSKDELFWIGYIYRYFSIAYEINSKKAYKTIKPSELRSLYLPYHTLDPLQAIERILEAKEVFFPKTEEEKIKLGVEILRKVKNERK